MRQALIAISFSALIIGCSTKGLAGEQTSESGAPLEGGSGAVSFAPGGQMYVFTHGMNLAVRKVDDERTFLLTASPPAAAEGKEEGGEEEEEAAQIEQECVPADPDSPLPGPQGGWHGHPAWSPDGRFIAFMAPWKDSNCIDGDDGDWDVWLVNVDGLDLDTWVREVALDKDNPGKKDHFIVGPGAAGLSYTQVSSLEGTEQRPAWADCRTLAYASESGALVKDLSSIPGICEKTMSEVAAEREARIEKLEVQVRGLAKQVEDLKAKITASQEPEPEAE